MKKIINAQSFKILVLSIIPLCLFVINYWIKSYSGFYWMGLNSDPEYAYLFNSLNIINSSPIGHIDHPGTPLQMLGAMVLRFVHLFRGGGEVTLDVLQNPEIYLNSINYFLVILLALSIFAIAVLLFKVTKKITLAIFFQLTPLLSITSLWTLNRVSPEPLLLTLSLWVSFIVLYIVSTKKDSGVVATYIYPLLTGLTVATKINALPLVLIGLVLLPFKKKIIYLFYSIVSFFIFTWPIRHYYKVFFSWIARILTHSGKYGFGEAKIIDIDIFYPNLLNLAHSEKLLILVSISILITLTLSWKRNKLLWFRAMLGTFLFLLIEIFVVLKHFSLHYLIPGLSVLGLSISLLTISLDNIRKKTRKVVISVIVVVLITFSIKNIQNLYLITHAVNPQVNESLKVNQYIQSNYPNAVRVYHYRSSSLEYALGFGNRYARNVYSNYFMDRYYNVYFYNIWTKRLTQWGRSSAFPENRDIILQGIPFKKDYSDYLPNFSIYDMYGGESETLYMVDK